MTNTTKTLEERVKGLLDAYTIETLSGRTDLEGVADIYRAFWETMKEKLTPGIESFAREIQNSTLDACRESITNIETVGGNNLSEEGKLEFVRGYNCANIDQIEAIDSLRTVGGKEV